MNIFAFGFETFATDAAPFLFGFEIILATKFNYWNGFPPGMKDARDIGGMLNPLSAPGRSDWGIPKGRGIRGAEANLNRSNSDSCNLLVLARRFWNQIFTWVSVNFSCAENSARSAIDKYCFSRNFFSSALSCWVVKGVLGFRLGLCFLRVHRSGPGGGLNLRSENRRVRLRLKLKFAQVMTENWNVSWEIQSSISDRHEHFQQLYDSTFC